MTPVIGIVCFAIILASWFGGVRYCAGIPAGLVAIAVGHRDRLGLQRARPATIGGMSVDKLGAVVRATSASRCRCRRSATCSAASSSSASSWSPRSRSASTTWSRRWTTSRARRSRATAIPTTRVLDRRRRGQPDRLPDGQSVHQRRLHRPPGLEGDGRAHRLLGGDRHHGDRARRWFGIISLMLVADPGRRDLADPALHRHADRRAGVPGDRRKSHAPAIVLALDAAPRGLGQAA